VIVLTLKRVMLLRSLSNFLSNFGVRSLGSVMIGVCCG
jgi:hypothetical protein